jgi:hypothetical protein
MKEARLQNPVLMNKNRIQRRVSLKDEVARHTEVQALPYKRLRRCGSDRRKVIVLTRGGLINHEWLR